MLERIAGFEWDAGNRAKCTRHGVSIAEIESVFDGTVQMPAGFAVPAGVIDSYLHDVSLGDNCLVRESRIASADIGREVVIEQEELTPEQKAAMDQMRNMMEQTRGQMNKMREQMPGPPPAGAPGMPAAPAEGQPAQ